MGTAGTASSSESSSSSAKSTGSLQPGVEIARARAAISMASATVSSDGFEADGTISTVAGAKLTVSLQKRITVAVSTTVYLCAVMTGTFGAASCWGNLSARRRR